MTCLIICYRIVLLSNTADMNRTRCLHSQLKLKLKTNMHDKEYKIGHYSYTQSTSASILTMASCGAMSELYLVSVESRKVK